MRPNYTDCMEFTLKYEGGYSSVRSDPGNWTGGKVGVGVLKGTKFGISAKAYPNLDIKNLTIDQAKTIYEKSYWLPVKGDDLPSGVDLSVFDAGVMSGPSRGVKWLQKALGVSQDGIVGPKTLAALKGKDVVKIIKAVCANRQGFVESLKTFITFGKGWTSRIAACEAASLRLYLSSNAETKPITKDTLRDEADTATKTADHQNAGAVGAVGGGGASTIVVSDQVAHWLAIGLLVAILGLVIYLVWRAHVNTERAAAFENEAAKV